jgi:hypothetical protein
VISFTYWLLYSRRKDTWYPLDRAAKGRNRYPCRESNSGHSDPQLYRLDYPGSYARPHTRISWTGHTDVSYISAKRVPEWNFLYTRRESNPCPSSIGATEKRVIIETIINSNTVLKNYKNTGRGRQKGEYKNNDYFKHCNYKITVFEIIIVFITTRFSAAPFIWTDTLLTSHGSYKINFSQNSSLYKLRYNPWNEVEALTEWMEHFS